MSERASASLRYLQWSTRDRQALDTIRVRNISLLASFTDGAQWPSEGLKAKLQPIELTVAIKHSVASAALTDDLDYSINYSTICKTAIAAAQSRNFASSEDCVEHVISACFDGHKEVQALTVTLRRPKALLQPASIELIRSRRRGSSSLYEELYIRNIETQPIVGVNACEREQIQLVCFDISMQRTISGSELNPPFPFRDVALKVVNAVNATSFLTLEALVAAVVDTVALLTSNLDSITVCGGKPNALSCAEAAEVKITRTAKEMYAHSAVLATPGSHAVALALGSNLGDRFANIELALQLLEAPTSDLGPEGKDAYVTVVDTSFMYETEPMYETDQPKFINCACLVHTNIEPVGLLRWLKYIENTVGRVVSYRNGPRAIDLDILTYDDLVLDTRDATDRKGLDSLEGQLVIPHPRIFEREFVLRPLNDIIPNYVHPGLKRTVSGLFASLMASLPHDNPVMYRVIPFPQYPLPSGSEANAVDLPVVPPTASYWTFPAASASMPQAASRKTYAMATLNATPDSFSDGSVNNTVPAALRYATSAVANGADIVDIGGYSTRPGAQHVSPEEETNRVIPVIHAIRNATQSADVSEKVASQARQTLISVDTFRWDVAEAAVKAGANCINDVYSFTGPTWPVNAEGKAHLQKFREVARSLAVPVILMHSRGEASANKDYSMYDYAKDARGRGAVLEAVRVELGEKVDAIVKGKGGLRRWLVIVDPGVGFSKTVEGNLELLRQSSEIVNPTKTVGRERLPNPLAGYPLLVGASRKSFLGVILAQKDASGTYEGRETKPIERTFATAAAVACAVQQGATVVRVHDVLEMGDVARVSSLLWG